MKEANPPDAQHDEHNFADSLHRISAGTKILVAAGALVLLGATIYVAGLLNAQITGAAGSAESAWVLYGIYAAYLTAVGGAIHGVRVLFD